MHKQLDDQLTLLAPAEDTKRIVVWPGYSKITAVGALPKSRLVYLLEAHVLIVDRCYHLFVVNENDATPLACELNLRRWDVLRGAMVVVSQISSGCARSRSTAAAFDV